VTAQNPSGFWSYVHADDAADGGRVIRLCKKIQAEYEMITGGSSIEFFVDRDKIEWGAKWRSVIDDALTETAFFIPIVTARYVQRPECRRELLRFSSNATRRGVPELILPILYSPVPGLDENATDEVKSTIASTQYEDWTDLRFEDEESASYRRAVNKLALRIAQIADDVSTRPEQAAIDAEDVQVAEEIDPTIDLDDDDAPGLLDAMADVETGFPEWTFLIDKYQSKIREIGELFTMYEPKMTQAGNVSSGARLLVTKRLAKDLDPLADELVHIGSQYLEKAQVMDGNLMVVLSHVAESSLVEAEKKSFMEFGNTLRGIVENGEEACKAVEEFQAQANNISRISKDIRRPLRKVAEGAQGFLDGQNFFDAWVRRLDEIEAGL